MLRTAKATCTNISRHSAQRAQSTAASVTAVNSGSKAAAIPPAPSRKPLSPRTIYLRPWDGISSMPEAFAIIRGIERKFGKIRTFHFIRDYEVSELYQPHFWAEFEEDSSMKHIPLDPKSEASVVQIDVPVVNAHQPGGVGLADLYGLLEPGDRVTEVEKPWESVVTAMVAGASGEQQNASGMRTVSVKIERTESFVPSRTGMSRMGTLSQSRMLDVGRSFALWGGFYKAPPPPAPIEEGSSDPKAAQKARAEQRPPSLQRMRLARAKWEPILKQRKERVAEISGEDVTQEESSELLALNVDPAEEPIQETLAETQPVIETQPATDTSIPVAPDVKTHEESTHTATIFGIKKQPHITRRKLMLEQARKIARTPLPESVKPLAKEELHAKEEQEKQETEAKVQAQQTIRERLQNLMGGKWF